MANIEQEYTLKVVTKGLKEVVSELKQLNKGLGEYGVEQDKVNKSTDAASSLHKRNEKGMKGVAGATNNATKAFSKMNDGMVGSLVPAYATVAANVFALTAAFGALERAADLDVLINSSEKLAETTGRSLAGLAKDMQEVTGGAISLKQSLTQASLAASAGFNNGTIQELTKAATAASRALGTDMADSMDRVFRGAIKAEPELLDELGIILRLQPATKKYAATLGKTAKELTTFEKQQAIVNEVIQQAQDKFGAFGDIDPNPYTKLAASLKDISNAALSFISIPLGGIASLLGDNVAVLGTLFALLARNIVAMAEPALIKVTESVQKFSNTLENTLVDLDAFAETTLKGQDPRIINKGTQALERYRMAIVGVKDSAKAGQKLFDRLSSSALTSSQKVNSAIASIGTRIGQLKKGKAVEGLDLGTDKLDEQLAILRKMRAELIAYKLEAVKASKVNNKFLRLGARGLGDVAEGLQETGIAAGKTFGKISKSVGIVNTLKTSFDRLKFSIVSNIESTNMFSASLLRIGRVTGTVAGSIAAIGVKLLNNLPILAGLAIAWETVTGLMHKFGATDLSGPMQDQADTLKTTSNSITNYIEEIAGIPDTIDNITKKITFQANVFSSITDTMKKARDEIAKQGGFDFIDRALSVFNIGSFEKFRENLDEISKQLSNLGYNQEVLALTEKYGTIQSQNREKAKEFMKELDALGKTVNKNIQNVREGTKAYNDLFDSLGENISAIGMELPKLNNTQKVLADIQGILAGAGSVGTSALLSGLERLSEVQLRSIGLENVIDESSQATIAIENLTKAQNEYKKELDRLESNRKSFLAKNREESAINIPLVKKQIKSIGELLDNISNKQEQLRNKVVNALQSVINKSKELISVDENLARVRQAALTEKVISTSNLEKRIQLTERLTNAELEAINIKAEDNPDNLKIANKVVEESKVKLTELNKKLQEYNNLKAEKGSLIKQSDIDSLQSQIKTVESTYNSAARTVIQLNTLNEKAITDKSKVLQKELDIVLKELSKFNKFGDVEVFSGSIKYLEDKIPAIVSTLNKNLKDAFKLDPNQILEQLKIIRDRAAQFRGTGFVSSGIVEKDRQSIVSSNQSQLEKVAALGRELALNEQVNGVLDKRVDKQFLLKKMQLETQLLAEKDLLNQKAIQESIDINEANRLLYIEKQSIALSKQTKEKLQDLSITGKLAKQQLDISRKASIFDSSEEARAKYIKDLREINKLSNKISLAKEFESAAASMNKLASAQQRLTTAMQETPLDRQVAALKLMQAIGDDISGPVGNAIKSVNTLTASLSSYYATLEANKAKEEKDTQNLFNKELADTAALYSTITNAGYAMAGMFDKGSDAAKAFTLLAQGAAVASAAQAVAEAATLPPPAGFASAGAMLGLMTSVLGMAGIAFGGSSTNDSQATNYQNQYNDQGIAGLDTTSSNNGLIKAIDTLSGIDTELFSASYDLKVSVNKLNTTFNTLGNKLFDTFSIGNFSNVQLNSQTTKPLGNGGTDATTALLTGIGGVLGTTFGGPVWGAIGATVGATIGKGLESLLGKTKVTQEIVNAGIKFGLVIEEVGGELVGAITDTAQFVAVETTKKKSSWFGLKKSVTKSVEEQLSPLGLDIASGLSQALGQSIDSAFNGLTVLAENAGADLNAIISGIRVDTGTIPLSFDAMNQSDANATAEAISNLFTTITNETIAQALPHVEKFRQAGDDLTTTLFKLAERAANVTSTLKTIDFSNVALAGFDEAAVREKILSNFNGALAPLNGKLPKYIIGIIKQGMLPNKVELNKLVQQQRVAMNDFWNSALEASFGGMDNFRTAFSRFSSAIYSDSELAQIALDNASVSVQTGLEELKNRASNLGFNDLVSLLDFSKPTESLRSFVDAAYQVNAFSAKPIYDEAGNIIKDLGQELLTTTINVGNAIANVTDATEKLNNGLDDLLLKYQRQIAAFGLVGKELDLLNLDFNFQDAKKEALKLTNDLTLVETAFGLQRLDIIRKYNQEIVDSINSTFNNVSNSILTISKSFSTWDEVAYQTTRINNISKALGKTLNNVDLSVLQIDSSSLDAFASTFSDILNMSIDSPVNTQEQITMVESLKTAIVDRYNAELSSIEKINSGLKDLSVNISDFLDSILISDISPLTNLERLNEAQNQFDNNLANIFSTDTAVSERAQSNLIDSANALLEQASNFYAIGPQFNSIFANVTESLKNLGLDINNVTQSNEDRILNLTDSMATTAVSQLKVLDDILSELQSKQQSVFEQDISNALQNTLPAAINSITAKLSTIDQYTWGPILDVLSNLGSYAVGSNDVPFDQLALIHQGEAIIPKKEADALRKGSITTNTQFVAPDNSEVVNAIKVLTQVLADTQIDLLEQGEKIEQAAKENKIDLSVPANTKGLG